MEALEIVRTLATVVAAGGVGIATQSFRHTREQARTTFEDSLAREYRSIIGALPPRAFYRHNRAELADAEKSAMFRYFDLSNEQLRLIEEERIRPETARAWQSGISELMRLEAFAACWDELQQNLPSDFFTSLAKHLRT